MTRYWHEFTEIVAAKTLRDITLEDVERYHDRVWKHKEDDSRSAAYVRNRLVAVTTILRYALKKGRDQGQFRRVLDLCKIFELPAKGTTNPRPITPEDFATILEVAPVKFRAMLLTALNLALYPSEVAAVKKTEIDLNKRTFVGSRNKTGVVRVGVLWKRTVRAIRDYLTAEAHDSEFVFVSAIGEAYSRDHVGRNFRKLRTKAGVGEDVSFDMIRDGAYSAAIEGGADVNDARLLAGHRLAGVSDAYVRRNPRMVARACAAIERAYFGPKSKLRCDVA